MSQALQSHKRSGPSTAYEISMIKEFARDLLKDLTNTQQELCEAVLQLNELKHEMQALRQEFAAAQPRFLAHRESVEIAEEVFKARKMRSL